jgi:hypothetical protein
VCALSRATLYEGRRGRLSNGAASDVELEEEGSEKVQLATRVRTEGGQGQDATGKAVVAGVVAVALVAAAGTEEAAPAATVVGGEGDEKAEDWGAGATADEAGEALRSSVDPSTSAATAAAAACLRRTDCSTKSTMVAMSDGSKNTNTMDEPGHTEQRKTRR